MLQCLPMSGETIQWKDIRIFDEYDQQRAPFRPAAGKLIINTLDKFMGAGMILDIGSGRGELAQLAGPSFSDRLIQIDSTSRFNEKNKQTNSNQTIATADMYQLPFSDGSFTGVVGLSSIDTVSDLDLAIKEIKRVLKPNGTFIHFMDMPPFLPTILDSFPSNMIPFPYYDLTSEFIQGKGLQLVPDRRFDDVKNYLDEETKTRLEQFVQNPRYAFETLQVSELFNIAADVEQLQIRQILIPSLIQYFQNKLVVNLIKNNFTVQHQGNIEVTEVISKQDITNIMRIEDYPQLHGRAPNLCLSNPDSHIIVYDDIVETEYPGKVIIKSAMNVVVAQKEVQTT